MELFSTGDVAKKLGIARHKIEYAIATGSLPDAKLRVANKRCFSPDEVEAIAEYFENTTTSSEEAAKENKDEVDKETHEPN